MNSVPTNSIGKPTALSTATRAAALAACLLAGLFALSLSFRLLNEADLGYHLAYGEVFLDTGRIVNDAAFIHPTPSPADSGHDLPPGSYFDPDGNYRFINANWLTQAIYASLNRLAGFHALMALRIFLVAAILLAQAGILRRLNTPLPWIAPVWLATGLIMYERFQLRPELIAYACLAAQVFLLLGRLTWPRIAAAVALQLIAVNVHSYWLLGIAAAVALSADSFLHAAWHTIRRPTQPSPQLRPQLIRRAASILLLTLAAFANPFTWRGLIMPFQTLLYLRANNIASGHRVTVGQSHPWASIGEFFTPFAGELMHTRPSIMFIVLLAVMIPAAAALAFRRKWGLLALAAGFIATALSMRRNIAPAGMLLWPLAAFAAHMLFDSLRRRAAFARDARAIRLRPLVAFAPPACLILIAALAAVSFHSVITNRFYLSERREWRTGWGQSRLMLPLDTGRWLDRNLHSPQPVFTDYNISSGVLYWSDSATALPVLTNTWAYPACRMDQVLTLTGGLLPPDPTLRDWGINIVVTQLYPQHEPLVRALQNSPDWSLVQAQSWFLIFARRTDENAALIARGEITESTLDLANFAALCREMDPSPAFGLKVGAGTLQSLGWFEHAEQLWRSCLDLWPNLHEGWLNLGVCLAEQGRRQLLQNDPTAIDHFRQARRCFQHALELNPRYDKARRNLYETETTIRRIRNIDQLQRFNLEQ